MLWLRSVYEADDPVRCRLKGNGSFPFSRWVQLCVWPLVIRVLGLGAFEYVPLALRPRRDALSSLDLMHLRLYIREPIGGGTRGG